jgi:hypothetical protein
MVKFRNCKFLGVMGGKNLELVSLVNLGRGIKKISKFSKSYAKLGGFSRVKFIS